MKGTMKGKKIGEVLIEKGLITEEQLDTALKRQLMFGGHVGTCLIELGLVDEDLLGKTLSKICGVPYAAASALRTIPEAAIKAFPRRLAEEYHTVPLKIVDRTMYVAMVEPRNLQAIEAISFASGYKTVPKISPELRIFEALDKYYGISRSARYVTICRDLETKRDKAKERRPSGARSARLQKTASAEAEDRAGAGDTAATTVSAPTVQEKEVDFGYGRSWRGIAEELELAPFLSPASQKDASGMVAMPFVPAPAPPPTTLEELGSQLCNAQTKRNLIDTIMLYASARMRSCVLFAVNGELASVLASRGGAFGSGRALQAPLSVTKEAMFELLDGDDIFRGAPPLGDRYMSFYNALGVSPPAEVLLALVHVNDRLVAVFYGDGARKESILGETESYRWLFRMFALSLRMMLIKQKILSAAQAAAQSESVRGDHTDKPATCGPA